ncbi:LPFR motif small protein [Thermomonospora cellulosilytica]|uniref:Antitoxin component of RelBE/YafQ-DinJ toxin-antitoxin module n=1 Tax=Thermomonospora cellulosilytica TaxID=1411118 RepID=A0A7W3MXZ3_9ACTN|nr:LPFR motif small protein [Thermomonospora cellulosilytica]MBA9003969.1 antitoxin component of RelBE/YafQ-DinJ toxin-antitoxin module [Thermomonospora cellulosilytica]
MRRISAAVRMILSTLINVVTLPFRVIARLLSPSRARR